MACGQRQLALKKVAQCSRAVRLKYITESKTCCNTQYTARLIQEAVLDQTHSMHCMCVCFCLRLVACCNRCPGLSVIYS